MGLSCFLEWIAPSRCIGCGLPLSLSGIRDYPLCTLCEAHLKQIQQPRCERCGKELISEHAVCWECRQTSHTCSKVIPLFRYRGFEAELIRSYKAEKRYSLAPLWSQLLAQEIKQNMSDWIIVPVPPRREKILSGETDQIECIARSLEREGFQVQRLLIRNSKIQQKRLSKKERKENAVSAYAMDPRGSNKSPERVVLIDDVYTTGATLDACASALFSAGACEIAAVVLAAD